MGELVTAHLHQPKVKVCPISFPDFVPADNEFIKTYGETVDVSCLGGHGIGVEKIQAMLSWLRDIPDIKLAQNLSNAYVEKLSSQILSSTFDGTALEAAAKPGRKTLEAIKGNNQTQVAIITDMTNMESVSTGLILCKMVARLTSHIAGMIPYLLPDGEEMTHAYNKVIFVLSNGAFTNSHFLRNLLQAGKAKSQFIPIIAEDGFRFPSKDMLQELSLEFPSLMAKYSIQAPSHVMLNLIKDVFKEIAIVFAPQDYSSTEQLLKTKAENTAQRLLSTKLQSLAIRDDGKAEESTAASTKDGQYISGEIDDELKVADSGKIGELDIITLELEEEMM
jgi:hypothetical protein